MAQRWTRISSKYSGLEAMTRGDDRLMWGVGEGEGRMFVFGGWMMDDGWLGGWARLAIDWLPQTRYFLGAKPLSRTKRCRGWVR